MKALATRIGPYRVAALLIGCALGLEIFRVEALSGSKVWNVAATFGEVAFLALAAGAFIIARRERRHS